MTTQTVSHHNSQQPVNRNINSIRKTSIDAIGRTHRPILSQVHIAVLLSHLWKSKYSQKPDALWKNPPDAHQMTSRTLWCSKWIIPSRVDRAADKTGFTKCPSLWVLQAEISAEEVMTVLLACWLNRLEHVRCTLLCNALNNKQDIIESCAGQCVQFTYKNLC